MKLLSLFALVLVPFAVAVPASDTEGIKDDVDKFINEKIIYKAVDAATPLLAKEINKAFAALSNTTAGSLPPMLGKTFDSIFTQPWFDSKDLPYILKFILKPLRDREIEFKAKFIKDINVMYADLTKGAEAVTVSSITKALKMYFAVGDSGHQEPAKVNITHTGPNGWIQRKIEQVHATVIHVVKPNMHEYMSTKRQSVLNFAEEAVQDAVTFIVGRELATIGFLTVTAVKKIVTAAITPKIVAALDTAADDAVLMINTGLREAVYSKFGFLKGDIKPINDQVSKK